ELNGVRNVDLAPGSTVTPVRMEVAGSISSLGLLSPNNLVFTGSGSIPASSANVVYKLITIGQSSTGYTPLVAVTAPQGLTINGPFTVGPNAVTVSNLLVFQPTGLLIMNNGLSDLTVATLASFNGGNETGQLTAGTLRINGSMALDTTNSTSSFRASG